MTEIVFVYSKDGKIKVFNIKEAKNKNQELLEDGWKHTATLNPCVFIEYLCNSCDGDDFMEEMKSLRKPYTL